MSSLHLALDLGAGSGRAFLGEVGPDRLALQEVHRFHYEPRPDAGRLRWDLRALGDGLRHGLPLAVTAARARGGRLASVGVDSWGVDYVLLDAEGRLLEDAVCYRDSRTAGLMEEAEALAPREEVYRRTGIQFLPFNTLYQLLAHRRAGIPPQAHRLLLMPDFCHHLLCGSQASERTNASTTQMLNAETGAWDQALLARFDLPVALLPEVVPAGTRLGGLRADLAPAAGEVSVVAPATHDTGSAVAGTPLQPGWGYISSGTWSLVGVERATPLLTDAAREANVTNEAGAYGTFRLLKNVMGLWLLERCRKEWRAADLDALLGAVADVPGFVGFVFPDHPRFFNPPHMTRELRGALAESGQVPHEDPVLLAKVILDSLALRYADVVRALERLTGEGVAGLHVVGGGSRNDYLNQATAEATGRPVRAGPVEATVCGNLLVQAVAHGTLASLAEGRAVLARAHPISTFEPRHPSAWREAAERYHALSGRDGGT
jgi:rhamnulokinase